ncbi:hypothetical protein GVN16_02470 [Emticicia sp. CRIBPO]|uniref:hypothetical protein n=1 Tax=Emticicia sp. CRIBPO TaxID=2683258 RepID=UPI0014133318|nr:hypothetical protein [Emticicia sp. CRIBPO]NBA84603.1 hypothetical protein [Emticicia sp. CRIBPO]
MMKQLVLLILLSLFTSYTKAQESAGYYRQGTPPKTVLLSVGPTLIGVHADAGIFLKDNLLIGVNAERHEFLSSRREAGGFIRRYGKEKNAPLYLQAGLSYGHFKNWDWSDWDTLTELSPLYKSFKASGFAGFDLRISKQFSIGGEAGGGFLLKTTWFQPSLKLSLTCRL